MMQGPVRNYLFTHEGVDKLFYLLKHAYEGIDISSYTYNKRTAVQRYCLACLAELAQEGIIVFIARVHGA